MLGLRFAARGSCAQASTSSFAASIHSSAITQAAIKRKGSHARANLAKRAQLERVAQLNRPHVVLGNKPGDDSKWNECDLSKVLVTQEQIQETPPLAPQPPLGGGVQLPKYTNFGLGKVEKELLFETLPEMSEEAHHLALQAQSDIPIESSELAQHGDLHALMEHRKASMLARVVDLRNANAKGIAYENRRRCIATFSEDGSSNDTGRPEVQAAILTMRIRNVWDHLNRSKKDVFSRRSLRTLIHKRAKVLRYLKRVDRDRYDLVLERLGLEPASVEGELVV